MRIGGHGVAGGLGLLFLLGGPASLAADASGGPAAQPQQHFVAGTNNYPPWYFDTPSDASRPGAVVEAVRDVAKRAGFAIDVAALPNARLVQSLKDGTVDFTVAPDEPVLRHDDLNCGSIGAVARSLISSRSAPITSLDHLENRRIGLARPYGLEQGLGPDTGAVPVPLDSIEQGLRMLAVGRIDGVLGLEAALRHVETLRPELATSLAPALLVARQEIDIWVSSASSLKDRCEALRAVAAGIRADNMIERVLSRY